MLAALMPAVCRSHQPYPSRLVAQRAADVHPLYALINCPKCDEGRPFAPFRCTDDPSHWHVGHGFPVDAQEVAVMTVETTPSTPVALPAPPSRRSIKLSADQCREIVHLYHVEHLNPRVIAARFDVVPQTVHEVAKGRTYLWATRELLPALGIVVPPNTTKNKPRQVEQEAIAVHITKHPTVFADSETKPTAQLAASPSLVSDMADALEMLLSQEETTALPRFVVTAVRELIVQARAS